MLQGLIQGLFMGLSKAIAVKIIQKRYAGTDKANDETMINNAANRLFPLLALGMLAAIALIIWGIVEITGCNF